MTVALGPEWLQPDAIIQWLGPWALVGLALIIFAECGLLLGFFLPGDSLLFTAGLFVANGAIDAPLWVVCLLLIVAAFAGNVCGYYIGRVAGPAIFDRPKSKLFKPEHVLKTQGFFDKYGNRAIVMARFVPVVRTFITVMAGVGRMEAKRFFTYSLIGGVAWAAGVTLLGFWLGQFEFVRNNIELMLILIVVLSVLPIVVEVVRARRESKRGGSGHAPGPDPAAAPPAGQPPVPGPHGAGQYGAGQYGSSTQTGPGQPLSGGYRPDGRPTPPPMPANYGDKTQPIPRHQPGEPRRFAG